MNALATWGTSGTSPSMPVALRRLLPLFQGEHRMTSIRVTNPGEFENLPPRFVLRRSAGVWWLVDCSAPRSPRGEAIRASQREVRS